MRLWVMVMIVPFGFLDTHCGYSSPKKLERGYGAEDDVDDATNKPLVHELLISFPAE